MPGWRGLALAANAQGYMLAVRQIGAGAWRRYVGHMLPNIAATLIVSATLAFPEVILAESGLSFLGLGVQPPMTSLGNMVGYARGYISGAPWILLCPSLVIVITTWRSASRAIGCAIASTRRWGRLLRNGNG